MWRSTPGSGLKRRCLASGQTPALRPVLISEVLKAQCHGKIMRRDRRNDRLEIIFALARNSDLIAENLSRDLKLGITNETGDLFGHGTFDPFLDLDRLPSMTERRNVGRSA